MSAVLSSLYLQIFFISEHYRIRLNRIDKSIKAVGQVKIKHTKQVGMLVLSRVEDNQIVRMGIAMWLERIVIHEVAPADLMLIQKALSLPGLRAASDKNQRNGSCKFVSVGSSQDLEMLLKKLNFSIA